MYLVMFQHWLSELLLINILMNQQICITLDSIAEWYWNDTTDVMEFTIDNS